jgi:hypothetical protein
MKDPSTLIDIRDQAQSWTVWRIDDNGNTFVVREHLDSEEAERLVKEFTDRGHKQMYWVERAQPKVGTPTTTTIITV